MHMCKHWQTVYLFLRIYCCMKIILNSIQSICPPHSAGVRRHQTVISEHSNLVPTLLSSESKLKLFVFLIYRFTNDFCSFARRQIIPLRFDLLCHALVQIAS